MSPADEVDPVVRDSRFADLQCNAALALARTAGMRPRDVAERIVEQIQIGGPIGSAEVSGPGYVNVMLADSWVSERVAVLQTDRRPASGTRVVIDYSSPNVAKEMHVGHLRTTVVGDALARIHEWVGDEVVRQNHIGDWGTPFGMLVEHTLDLGDSGTAHALTTDPNAFYQAARAKFEESDAFAARARDRVVALQAGDPATLDLWRELVARSRDYFNRVYDMLDVSLTDEDLAGESSYNDEFAAICDELEERGLAWVSDGALCAFPDGFTGRDGTPTPLIIRKSDGGYRYATTDLATVRHRVRDLHADEILYVVGAPQAQHFAMVWAVAQSAGWVDDSVRLEHVRIGNVLGADHKILRTRSGESQRLLALIDEAIRRAEGVLDETQGIADEVERRAAARAIGVGAITYADLSVSHDTEYVFDLERMTSLAGNTAPYLQYAIARIRSIMRHGDAASPSDGAVAIDLPQERALAVALLGFEGAVEPSAALNEPHRLCAYLFSLAQRFSSFYDAAPILSTEDATRRSRLTLCRRTEQVLVAGLDLLGIRALERM